MKFCLFLALALTVTTCAASLAEETLIGPGDVLAVTVLGEEALSGNFTVGEDGTVSLPLAEKLPVAGLSPQAAGERLAKHLAAFIKDPHVSLQVMERGKIKVALTGAVKMPGVYTVPGGTRVAELLLLAGGLVEQADRSGIQVIRAQGGVAAADLNRLAEGDVSFDPVLYSGDHVVVPLLTPSRSVSVVGQVARPGQYPVRESMPLWEAVALSGGLLPAASPSEAFITRASGEKVPVDLTKLLTADGIASEVSLRAGDTLTIPAASGQVYVLGAVQRPGPYPLKKGKRLHEVLADAGGPTGRARLGQSYLLRQQPQRPGGVERLPIKLDRLLNEGDFRENITIENGDIIMVPEAGSAQKRNVLQQLSPILGPLLYAIF